MNKVFTINLAGRVFSIEEGGFDVLRGYLESAERSLEGNPDKAEILADIESALAEKCSTYLNPGKNVITTEEAETIAEEMGPVSDNGDTHSESRMHSSPKRLYRIQEGEMIAGVCNGLAAYFDVDVTLVRIVFVLLAIFTSGGFCFAYFLMMIFIPLATTPQERASAMGATPTAKEVIDAVRRAYDTGSDEWRKWKQRSREERRKWRYQREWQSYHSPFWEFMQSVLGLVWFVLILWLCYWSYYHIPIAREFFNAIPGWLQELAHKISQK